MRYLPPFLIAVLLATIVGDTEAATSIYRCVGDDGIVRFQDSACSSGESGRKIELPKEPSVPRVEPSRLGTAVPLRIPKVEPPSESAPAAEPGANATLCTREDGSRYLSESGHGEQRAVPLAMLGVPGDSLADAYAGRDGIGVSAPGMRTPPVDRTRYGQLGAAYVWIEDPCARITAAQLCEFLDERVVDAERRLRYAFSDTSTQVGEELEVLRRRAKICRP